MTWPSINDLFLAAKYYIRAQTKYDAHSPFFFNFIKEVLDTEKEYYIFDDIENLRSKLLKINKQVAFNELGAGSKTGQNFQRSIREIAKTSSTSQKDGRILFNLANYSQAHCMLELGTSLGIGTAYLAAASRSSVVHTIEGNPASAYVASRNFDLLGLDNIHLHEGEFSDVLPKVLKSIPEIDVAYLDGNHTYEGTICYFRTIYPQLAKTGVMVLDDIYWSKGMNKAWEELKKEPNVMASIDIYSKGLLFFNPAINTESKHFTYVPTKLKPWRIGLVS